MRRGGFAFGQRTDVRVVEVADERVAGALVREDAELRFDVFVHRVIAVEMIGRDVEDRRDARLERADRFELKGRDLGDHPVVRRRGAAVSRISALPMLPPTRVLRPRLAEEMPDQRRGARLAFGSGHRDDRRARQAIRHLDLAEDGNLALLDAPDQRAVERNPRRKHGDVDRRAARHPARRTPRTSRPARRSRSAALPRSAPACDRRWRTPRSRARATLRMRPSRCVPAHDQHARAARQRRSRSRFRSHDRQHGRRRTRAPTRPKNDA